MSDLQDALDVLAAAHGPKALAEAMRQVQRKVRQQRRGETEGRQMAATIMAAVDLRVKLKADGATGDELNAGLEATVRATWPFVREWHYLCETCNDTGLELRWCADGKICGLAQRAVHPPHEYGVPCRCELGRRFKSREKTPEDTVARAAKVSKPPSRFGGR